VPLDVPPHAKKLRDLQTAMNREGRSAQFLLVTLDPAQRHTRHLRAFKESEELPAGWHFLTGTRLPRRSSPTSSTFTCSR